MMKGSISTILFPVDIPRICTIIECTIVSIHVRVMDTWECVLLLSMYELWIENLLVR